MFDGGAYKVAAIGNYEMTQSCTTGDQGLLQAELQMLKLQVEVIAFALFLATIAMNRGPSFCAPFCYGPTYCDLV